MDSNGVKYYPVTSVYQGSDQQIIRVLEPTNPVAGKPRRILYVLPVDQGVDTTDSTWSDGFEELRMLDVQDRFNMTLIAPSFNYNPWYGDNVTAPSLRMESFIIDDLIPWGDTFLKGRVPQRYLIGFSKSGNGVLDLMLRHPPSSTPAQHGIPRRSRAASPPPSTCPRTSAPRPITTPTSSRLSWPATPPRSPSRIACGSAAIRPHGPRTWIP